MKKYAVIFTVLGLTTSVAFAFLMAYGEERQPPISMPEAYTMATQALGSATNEFYCVHANTQISRSQDGEWLFSFCSTNGARKDVFVFLDKKTKPQVVDGGVLRY
jgi:hypothetical protein